MDQKQKGTEISLDHYAHYPAISRMFMEWALHKLGLVGLTFGTHSFRIGTVSTAVAMGYPVGGTLEIVLL